MKVRFTWMCPLLLVLGAPAATAQHRTTAAALFATDARTAPDAPDAPDAPVAPAAPGFAPYLLDVTRVDSWSFFEPLAGRGDPDYTLVGNRARIGVRVHSRRLDLHGAFQYTQIGGLPRQVEGQTTLGPGSLYYDAAHATAAFQLYFKFLSARVKGFLPGLSIEAGRMAFESGAEAPSHATAIDELRRDGLSARLLGVADLTMFERSFDGVRVDLERPRAHVTAALLFPTQGGFEESANPTIGRVRVVTGSATLRGRAPDRPSELQVFAHHYRDRRDIHGVRPDNTGLVASAADVTVTTIGGSYCGVYSTARGRIDAIASAAGQVGDWYGADHRAFSAMAEGGYQWRGPGRPWLGAGVVHASGDGDRSDATHGTFFPMIPSTRPGLLGATYAEMNLRDLFVLARVSPHPRLDLRATLHWLSLPAAADQWYSGTGATAIRGSYFGFTGRMSREAKNLGTLLEVSARTPLARHWTVNASLGVVSGGDVVRRSFVTDRLTVFSLESLLAFD